VGQPGFFDLDKRLEAISAKGDPLETLKAVVPFESFRAQIEAVVRLAPEERKSNAGRKPFDAVMMFKVLVLQTLYNLADEQVEYQIRDRLSFMRFLGLGLEDTVPDATTVWLFREALAKAGLVKSLVERFNQHLDAKGYIARGGQIVDATIVNAPKQHNTREENEAIKAGKTPEGWDEEPAKNAQKDKDARWTKKNDQSFYGYKNHVSVSQMHLIAEISPCAVALCATARTYRTDRDNSGHIRQGFGWSHWRRFEPLPCCTHMEFCGRRKEGNGARRARTRRLDRDARQGSDHAPATH